MKFIFYVTTVFMFSSAGFATTPGAATTNFVYDGKWAGKAILTYHTGTKATVNCTIDLDIRHDESNFSLRGKTKCAGGGGRYWDGWDSYGINNGELVYLKGKKVGTISSTSVELDQHYDTPPDFDSDIYEHLKIDVVSGALEGTFSQRSISWWTKNENFGYDLTFILNRVP